MKVYALNLHSAGALFNMWKTWSSGIDWLTVTAKTGSARQLHLELLARDCFRRGKNYGLHEKPESRGDYSGSSCGGLFMGWRSDSVEVIASSDAAHSFFFKLREHVPNAHITRCDIQATMRATDIEPEWQWKLYQEWFNRQMELPLNRRRSHDFKNEQKRGTTFYVGNISADVFSRNYYKSREQNFRIPDGIHRAEVVTRRQKAQATYEALCNASSVTETAHSMVKATLQSQGVYSDWLGAESGQRLPTTQDETSSEKTLRWFEKHVRGSVEREIDAGHLDELIRRLGLSSHVKKRK